MIRRPAILPALLLLLLLSMAGCTDRAPAARDAAAGDTNLATLGGTVSYRERIALTNEAVLVFTLEDVSRQDAAEVIASRRIADPGQVPIRFELEYPRDAIDPRMRLVARARITDRGRLLFTTEEAIPVLTRGGDREAHLLLVRAPDAGVNPVTTSPSVTPDP